MEHYGLFIGGEWRDTGAVDPVVNKYTGEVIATVSQADRGHVTEAVSAARSALEESGPLPPYRRYEILSEASRLLRDRAEEFALTIAREGGKPLKDARGEVARGVQTLLLSAEEAKRIHGEGVPVEAAPGSENRLAFTVRVPVGVVCAISPFNFPLNLVLHKVAPALAAGNAVVHKPAGSTPVTAAKLATLLAEAGLPPGFYNVLFGSGSTVGNWLLDEPDIDMYTFTGSPAVGRRIKEESGLRRVTLELGNNSATIVHEDADLDSAVPPCVAHSFGNAGQVCISVQRLYVHEGIFDVFAERFIAETSRLKLGDPTDPATDVGPMIDEKEAARAEEWVMEAVAKGAEVLCGGNRDGALMEPTVLVKTRSDMKVVCDEIFAPVVSLIPYRNIDEAFTALNASRYGLQAGIFTESLEVAMAAARKLRVGGVIVNGTPSYRVDLMPYGGVKESGIGREGPRYAIEEMTDLRLVVLNLREGTLGHRR